MKNRKYRYILLALMMAQLSLFAQVPAINLKYSGVEPILQLNGHLRNPQWSVSGSWLGFDFLKEDMISVVFYSIKSGYHKDFAIGERKSKSISAYAPIINYSGANTYNVAWTPSRNRDALYVISSLNKKYELFFIKTIRSTSDDIMVSAMKSPESDPNLRQKQISYLSFPLKNLQEISGAFIASDELSSDVWLILEKSNQTNLTQITFSDNTRKYDPRLSVSDNGMIKIAYLGIQGTHTDIYYKPSYKYQAGQNQPTATINISKTPYAIEKMPHWSPDGKYLAYLSTEGHMNLNNVDINAKEEDIICGLWVYDMESQMA
ncbi:MAG: hypothetical protein L6422_11000, partial [Candidatus Marinimicrobia bacterium]|nr:hypothetical protein [bacterium]MCG2716774.1 hypothetical protein [Candidatus Neomarinimicrobiota bacterium]